MRMESSNLNSINDVESDRASLHLPAVEITCDGNRYFAGAKQDYLISLPPVVPTRQLPANVGQTTDVVLFQCSRNRQNYESGSDSAEEEHSPYSSTEKLKYEALVPTGNQQENCTLRTKPSNPPDAKDVTLNQYPRSQYPQMNLGSYTRGPSAEETFKVEATEALALTGSLKEKSTHRQVRGPDVMPRGEMENPFNDGIAGGPDIKCPNNSNFQDVDIRLTTFFEHAVDWPHRMPSPEQMARAGMIYKGVFTIKGKEVFDMVECYKCGKTLYGFTENDDPVVEHKKYYPDCH